MLKSLSMRLQVKSTDLKLNQDYSARVKVTQHFACIPFSALNCLLQLLHISYFCTAAPEGCYKQFILFVIYCYSTLCLTWLLLWGLNNPSQFWLGREADAETATPAASPAWAHLALALTVLPASPTRQNICSEILLYMH